MKTLAGTQEKVMSLVTSFLTSEYSDLGVNYPDRKFVDVDTHEEPFIEINILYPDIERAGVGDKELFIRGNLFLTYYSKRDSGSMGGLKFYDAWTLFISENKVTELTVLFPKMIRKEKYETWAGFSCVSDVVPC